MTIHQDLKIRERNFGSGNNNYKQQFRILTAKLSAIFLASASDIDCGQRYTIQRVKMIQPDVLRFHNFIIILLIFYMY